MKNIKDNNNFQEFLGLLESFRNEDNKPNFQNFLNELHASVQEFLMLEEINNEEHCKTRLRGLMKWTGDYDSYPKAMILYEKIYEIHQTLEFEKSNSM